MESLKLVYRNLETRVLNELRNKIEKSSYVSEHTGKKAIRIVYNDFTEIAIVNDTVTLISSGGYHYNILNNLSLEELIDILEN